MARLMKNKILIIILAFTISACGETNVSNKNITDDNNTIVDTVEVTLSIPVGEDNVTEVNSTIALVTTITPADLVYNSITYSVAPQNIASVDNSGTVTGNNVGFATITVTVTTNDGSYTDDIIIEVVAVHVDVPEVTLSIPVGEDNVTEVNSTIALVTTITPADLVYNSVAYSVVPQNIASVDNSGTVTGDNVGFATVTVTITTNDGSYTDDIIIEVVAEDLGYTILGDEWLIHNLEGMKAFRDYVNNGNYGQNARLVADIVMDNVSWVPIADGRWYEGVFNGDNFTISYLYIDNSSNIQGLFKDFTGTIKNLRVTDANVNGGKQSGVIAGTNDGTLISSFVDNSTVVSTSEQAGGLVGFSYKDSLTKDSHVSNTSVTGLDNISGAVGNNDGNIDNVSVHNVTLNGIDAVGGVVGLNSGTVTNLRATSSSITGEYNVGGVVGLNGDNLSLSNADTVTVNGIGSVGGIVGSNNNLTVGTYVTNSVIIGTGNEVGGVAGTNVRDLLLSHADNMTITGADRVGGIIGAGKRGSDVNGLFASYINDFSITSTGSAVGGVYGSIDASVYIRSNYFLLDDNGFASVDNATKLLNIQQLNDNVTAMNNAVVIYENLPGNTNVIEYEFIQGANPAVDFPTLQFVP